MLSVIKQTNYKMITEKQFWLYTHTLMGIFNHYIISHRPEQTCQSSDYFVIYQDYWLQETCQNFCDLVIYKWSVKRPSLGEFASVILHISEIELKIITYLTTESLHHHYFFFIYLALTQCKISRTFNIVLNWPYFSEILEFLNILKAYIIWNYIPFITM